MRLLILIISLYLMTSCSKYMDIFKNQVVGRKLSLVNISGYTKSNQTKIDLIINKDTFYGFSGCNEYSGVFKINKRFVHFSLDNVGTKVCQSLNDEKEYLRRLVKTVNIVVKNGKLYFRDRDYKVLLTFQYNK